LGFYVKYRRAARLSRGRVVTAVPFWSDGGLPNQSSVGLTP